MRNPKWIMLSIMILTGCAGGNGYHVEAAPVARASVFRQEVDFLVVNDCAPIVTILAHGVHQDSVIAVVTGGGHRTIRLRRPMFASDGSFTLTLLAQAYRADTTYIGSARKQETVSYNRGYKQPVWQLNRLSDGRCPGV